MTQTPLPAAPRFAQADLKLYARLAWRWSWLVILCALLGAAGAFLVSRSMRPIYEAASKVMINEARSPTATYYNDILASERVARTYADLMKRASVMEQAFLRLGLDPSLARGQITAVTVTPVRDTQLVALTVEGPNPQLIAAVANTLPAVFVDELRQIQSSRYAESKASLSVQLDELSRQVDTAQLRLDDLKVRRSAQDELEYSQLSSALAQYKASYANLLQRYETLRLTEAQAADTIVLIEPAAVPQGPVRPRVLINALVAAMVGALLALGAVFLLEYLDDRVQTPEALERVANLPVLGAIGQTPNAGAGRRDRGRGRRSSRASAAEDEEHRQLISITDPRHPIVEAYRRLRTNLQYYNLDTGLKSLMLTSAEAGEGKSSGSANLAVVMAQSGARVILVDADLRKPRQHHLFGVRRQPGLAEGLRTSGFSLDLLQDVPSVPNLRLLTAGEQVPNPAEVLGSQRMRDLVARLHEEADIVIFDTPPLLAVTDAQVVGHLAAGVLLVINSQKTGASAVHRALQALRQANVPAMGAVLNRVSASGRSYYYYRSYYSHDYYSDGRDGGRSGSGGKRRDGGGNRPGGRTAPDSHVTTSFCQFP